MLRLLPFFVRFRLMLVDILVYEDHEGSSNIVKEERLNEMTGTNRSKDLKL